MTEVPVSAVFWAEAEVVADDGAVSAAAEVSDGGSKVSASAAAIAALVHLTDAAFQTLFVFNLLISLLYIHWGCSDAF